MQRIFPPKKKEKEKEDEEEEEETLEHFLMNCEYLETKRNYELLSKYEKESKEETVGSLLFKMEKEDLEPLKKMLSQMWKKRDQLIKDKEKNTQLR